MSKTTALYPEMQNVCKSRGGGGYKFLNLNICHTLSKLLCRLPLFGLYTLFYNNIVYKNVHAQNCC